MLWSGIMLCIYLGLAPVYWVPVVSPQHLHAFKLTLLGAAVAIYWAYALLKKRIIFPPAWAGWGGFILLVAASTPGLLQASSNTLVERSFDIVMGYVMLWTAYGIFIELRQSRSVLALAGASLLMFSLITLLPLVHPVFSINAPPEFHRRSVQSIGFGGTRTGWSNALSLYFPLVFGYVAYKVRTSQRKFVGLAAVAGIFLGSQLVVGGRAGLLGSLVAIFILIRPAVNIVAGAGIAGTLGLSAYFLRDYIAAHLRLDRIVSTSDTFQSLDNFSAGRLEGYVQALELIGTRPLLGHGFGEYTLEGLSGEIHNLWLRLAVESGVVLPIILLVIALYLVTGMSSQYGRALWRAEERVWISALEASMAAGLIVSLLEPNAILGTFQNSAMWWAAGGAALSARRQARVQLSSESADVKIGLAAGETVALR